MLNPNTTLFLCDKCQGEFLYRDLEVKAANNHKYCKKCYAEREKELTPKQHSLLIFLYNNEEWVHIDQGNLLNHYEELHGTDFLSLHDFLADLQALIINKYVRTHTLDAFYQITQEGREFIKSSEEPLIYQCCQCGDYYTLDNIDLMILEAMIEQNPDSTVIEDTCDACQDENERDSRFWDDPDHEHDTWDNVLVYGEDPE